MDASHIWTVGKCIQNNYCCIVLYCIVCYKYSSVVDGDPFWVYEVFGLLKVYFKFVKCVISVSKTRSFENDLFFIS